MGLSELMSWAEGAGFAAVRDRRRDRAAKRRESPREA